MPLKEVQNLLAQIYTDADLRENFLAESAKIGVENGLNENEVDFLKQVCSEELRFFAESLFYKRLHAVEKLMPLARKALGEEFVVLFRNFTRSFQPQNAKKHLEDAVNFAKYLQNQRLEKFWFYDLISFELANLEFHGCGRRFVFRRFRFDIRDVLKFVKNNETKNLSRRRTFALWFLINKNYHFIF